MTDRSLALAAWESLFRAQHELFAEFLEDFEGATVSQAEYDVLLTVTRAPGMTCALRDVTRLMLISQPSVSRLVDKMEKRGLVIKSVDPADGRASLVTATPEGARAFRALATVHARSIAERMSVLTSAEQNELLKITSKLRAAS